jgi:NAD(P)-dependent dehydrogenase (short-subunit alcohol dehydrogenase family)
MANQRTVLVIGASRGLGMEFVQQYLADDWKVIATVRKVADINRLKALGATAYKLNVTKPADFVVLSTILARQSIDVAIYNAGVYGPKTSCVEAVAKADFDAVMRANVWGAMHAIPAIAPAVARGKGAFVFMSSMKGSIAKMSGPSAVIYRASKSALNAVVKAASMEWADKNVIIFVMHPGWVKTDMGGKNADIEPTESVAGMRKVILRATTKYNGGFFDYTGQMLPW